VLKAKNDFLIASIRGANGLDNDIALEIRVRCEAPPPPTDFKATITSDGYDHTTPGQPSSEFPSTVCADFETDPAQATGSWEAELSAGVTLKNTSGSLDANGRGRVVFGIPRPGTYTITLTIVSGEFKHTVSKDIFVPTPPPSDKSKDCSAPPAPA
jgi:hypothetical protein